MRTCRLMALVGLVLAFLPALVTGEDEKAKPVTVELKDFTFKTTMADLFGHNTGEDKLFFYTSGTGEAKVKVPKGGDYEIVIKASGDKAMKEGAKFKVAIDGKQVGKETETTDEQKEYTFPAKLKAGEQKLSIEFTNDVFKEGEYDRNLYVHEVSVKPKK
ncbi:MAG: carbohydrate-binding domain-containing protein [Gemmataceae bacterium]